MSYDLAVWSHERPMLLHEAKETYAELCEGNSESLLPSGRRSSSINLFLSELVREYPAPNSFSDDDLDKCAWNCDLDISEAYVLTCINYSRVQEVRPFISKLAIKHNLTCYDPQQQVILLE